MPDRSDLSDSAPLGSKPYPACNCGGAMGSSVTMHHVWCASVRDAPVVEPQQSFEPCVGDCAPPDNCSSCKVGLFAPVVEPQQATPPSGHYHGKDCAPDCDTPTAFEVHARAVSIAAAEQRGSDAERARIIAIIERFGSDDYGLGWDHLDLLAAIKEHR